MAYSDQKMSGGKIGALVFVVLIHLALGYAFVTGLAYQFVKAKVEKLKTFDVAPPPPPPPPPPEIPPPPPPPDQKMTPPPVVSPPPIVKTVTPPPQIATVTTPPPPTPPTPPTPPSPPHPPSPPTISQAAQARGNPGQYFGPDAYPAAAIRASAQGRVVARLVVGTDGRVTECSVATSSNNADLDSTTCRIAKARVRYTPAKDTNGNPIASTVTLPVRWQLPPE